mgnify:CR=1 FL=1
MGHKESKIDAGKILISAPHLSDFFSRTVIFMTEYNENGSLGFVINRPVEGKLSELIEDFPEFDARVMLGGPVETEIVNFIHRAGDIIEGGLEICDGIFWGGNFNTLKLLAESGSLNPSDFIFFLGYSGWSAGQLDDELQENTWIVTESEAELIFDLEPDKIWAETLKRMGGEYNTIASFPVDPSVN